MSTSLRKVRNAETQSVEPFTNEGAYHGSTEQKPPGPPETDVAEEKRATTLERYLARGVTEIESFEADFPNRLELVERLAAPSQEQVRDDGVTFCWCPFEEAIELAGPLTLSVLMGMRNGLAGTRRYTYFDSKIQYFLPGDLPVDSCLRHVDESIAVRDTRVLPFGVKVLHDIRARQERQRYSPILQAYQSSGHCATGFLGGPLRLRMPELIPNFRAFDAAVRASGVPEIAHEAGTIRRYDGRTVHWATPATSAGWRLWARCVETDVEHHPNASVIECYGTVFRPRRPVF